MKKRNIAVCIILSIVTFGIYALYWFVQITNDINRLANPQKKTSGGLALLLVIVTCGIYGIYWHTRWEDCWTMHWWPETSLHRTVPLCI